jgi:hypothetical protein
MRRFAAGAAAVLLLASCSVVEIQDGPPLARAAWVLLPVQNLAEMPRAGERLEALLATSLRSRGIELALYPRPNEEEALPELDERRRFERALEWARNQSFRIAVSGTVTEWRYKSGLDGEPAVGIGIEVRDLDTGRIVWSAAGARTGWGHANLSGTAQKLLQEILHSLRLEGPGNASPGGQ